MNAHPTSRMAVLKRFGASPAVASEIVSSLPEGGGTLAPGLRFPLDDEPFVNAWRGYAAAAVKSDIRVLAERLVQLSFPIREGISRTDEYRAVTRKGHPPVAADGASGLLLEQPHACRILVHRTWAGAIPVIYAGCYNDFVSLVRAFTARNEPVPLPQSMGGCMVSGYNNWDRFRQLKREWMDAHSDETFSIECVRHLRSRYQDRFIILSTGCYSGVAPNILGVSASDWHELSTVIRREHEFAHYWTRRVSAAVSNPILDEIIADYCGIVAARGRFAAKWLLVFLGLQDDLPRADTGRLANYRGTPPLSDDAFALIGKLIRAAAVNLEVFDRTHASQLTGLSGLLRALLTLSQTSLEQLASDTAQSVLHDAFTRSAGIIEQTGERTFAS